MVELSAQHPFFPPKRAFRSYLFPVVVAVAAADHLFTGTLGSNWRLADAALTDDETDERLANCG
ncbi:hypothetical protein ACPESV_46580 [Streptomyces umbrinus]|uniref:hypothetical protein n=1 Tax=Streptomyces umbrinus TaxID=67370 RepID=UPI003C2F9503